MRAIAAGADNTSVLGRRLSVSKQAGAKTVAVLQQRGYVTHDPDPHEGHKAAANACRSLNSAATSSDRCRSVRGRQADAPQDACRTVGDGSAAASAMSVWASRG
jgi:hypothetical protein